MVITLCILTQFMNAQTASAGNVVEKPDPELLKKFEAELEAARAGQQQAREQIKRGEEKIKRAQEMRRQSDEKAIRELCAIGALPASDCP